MMADTLGASPLLRWREPIRWADACAIVKTYHDGAPCLTVTCWNGSAILYAVEHAHASDSIHIRPNQYVSL